MTVRRLKYSKYSKIKKKSGTVALSDQFKVSLKYFLTNLSIVSGYILLIIIFLYIISGYSLMGKSILGIRFSLSLSKSIHYHSMFYLLLFLSLHVGCYWIVKWWK